MPNTTIVVIAVLALTTITGTSWQVLAKSRELRYEVKDAYSNNDFHDRSREAIDSSIDLALCYEPTSEGRHSYWTSHHRVGLHMEHVHGR
jgi:hypothetical protein